MSHTASLIIAIVMIVAFTGFAALFFYCNMTNMLIGLFVAASCVITYLYLDYRWVLSIASFICLLLGIYFSKKYNTYVVYKRYLMYALISLVVSIAFKYTILYLGLPIRDSLDKISIVCLDILSVVFSLEAVYSSYKYPMQQKREENVEIALTKLREFSFYDNLDSLYKFNYDNARRFTHSLDLREINCYYNSILEYLENNIDTVKELPKEELLNNLFDLYKVNYRRVE